VKKPIVIIVIIAVVLLGVGAFFLVNSSDSDNDSTTTDTSGASQTQTENPSGTSEQGAVDSTATDNTATASVTTITYSDNGFSPSTITIKAGSTVEVKNTSSRSVELSSDPHPQHTDNPELNMGTLGSGKSKTITVSNAGTWGYHNHLDSSETGTIIVQ
jgi:plastocyanin